VFFEIKSKFVIIIDSTPTLHPTPGKTAKAGENGQSKVGYVANDVGVNVDKINIIFICISV